MENIPIILAEDIALLSLLSTVPEEPGENVPSIEVRSNNQQQRSLTFERERDLVDNLAFLSADTDDSEKVTALCVEENPDTVGLTIVLAVNKGSLARVEAGFEKMAKILQGVATQTESNDLGKALLNEVISLCEGRILSRLRSRHAEISIRNHLKPPLSEGLAKVIRMLSLQKRSQMPLDTDISAIRTAYQRFQELFRSLEVHDLGIKERHQLLADLIECAQTLTSELNIDRIINNLPNCADFDPNRAASLIGGLRKIGRYSSASEFLLRAARRLPIFKNIKVKVVALPTISRLPSLLGYFPDLAATMKRIDANVDHNRLHEILRPKTTVFGASIPYKFNQSTQKVLKSAKVHAEIQIVYHYEVHPVPNLPRVICSSKSACFLCDKFIKHHGKFFVARTHGRLYSQWKLPDLACIQLSNLQRKQQAAVVQGFKNDLEDKVRILLSRRDRLSHSHPNESVFIQPPSWTPSNTSLGREAALASRIRTPETSAALEIVPRESLIVSATPSESTARATDSTMKDVRGGFGGSILKGEGSYQMLLNARQDLSFFAGSIHLVVGIAKEWSDSSLACAVEVKWLNESESAQLYDSGKRSVINAMDIPQDREIVSGNRTEKAPNIFYVSLGSDIVSVACTLVNKKDSR